MELSQVVSFALAHALLAGVGLLVAALVMRFLGRAAVRVVLAVGLLITAVLAWKEWQAGNGFLAVQTILVVGLLATGLVALVVRILSLVVALALFAAGWYLLVTAWMGSSFVSTNQGSAVWGIAAILSMLVTDRLIGRKHRLSRAALLAVVPKMA
ncbi:MAG: hypothetical protein AABX97_03855 [Candidatus Thermoplasmatota archaeon]